MKFGKMSSLRCFCPCFGDPGTAASPEEARGDRGSHRGHRWRRSGSILSRLIRRGRRNGRDGEQEHVEQDLVMSDHHSNLDHPTQEEIRSESNATSSQHFEEIDQEHVEQPETNEIGPLIQEENPDFTNGEEVDESPTFAHRTVSYRDREHVRISLRVQLVIFFFFFLVCYNSQQEVLVRDLVPLMEESMALHTMVPNSSIAVITSPSLPVISPDSELNSSIENGRSRIKCVTILLGFAIVVGLYSIWESIYGAFMLAWCLLSGLGVRDELRLSAWINWVSMTWRDIEIELEREFERLSQ